MDLFLNFRHQLELESLQARHLEEISLFKRKLSQRSDVGPVIVPEVSTNQHPHTRSSSAPQAIQQVYYAPVLYQDVSPVHGTAIYHKLINY